MQALRTLFGNPFNIRTIRDARIAEFARDHIERLRRASPNGAYQSLLTETESAYFACFGTMTAEDQATAEREGLTQTTRDALVAFKAAVPDLEAAVRVAFGKSSPTHESFFPHGLTEYHKATLTTVPVLMERLVSLITTHEAKLGASILARFTQLRTDFSGARKAQQAKKGAVSQLKAASKETRSALELRLWKNALLLAAEHVGQPDQLGVFFDPTRLKPTR
ncbi:MAG: hypothetical protein NTX57_08650 [Armatimonadetes bacterium]|nr:hypothetical protein [Armatimonadota bacterium]